MTTHPIDEVVRLFSVKPEDVPDFDLGIRTMTIRVPVERLFWIDAMADHAELSRNGMVGKLLTFGIQSVLAQLPDEIRESIESDVADKAAEGI